MIEPVVRAPSRPGLRARGTARRAAIVDAAVALVLETGPGELTHRRIAVRAGVPLAATTYYFDSLATLVAETRRVLMDRWTAHAARVSTRVPEDQAAALSAEEGAHLVVEAILPEGDQTAVRGHYELLAGSGRSAGGAPAGETGRAGLTAAVTAILDRSELGLSASVAIAMVDGAALRALSEGLDVRSTSLDLVRATATEAPRRV